jgi:hypothetical protein
MGIGKDKNGWFAFCDKCGDTFVGWPKRLKGRHMVAIQIEHGNYGKDGFYTSVFCSEECFNESVEYHKDLISPVKRASNGLWRVKCNKCDKSLTPPFRERYEAVLAFKKYCNQAIYTLDNFDNLLTVQCKKCRDKKEDQKMEKGKEKRKVKYRVVTETGKPADGGKACADTYSGAILNMARFKQKSSLSLEYAAKEWHKFMSWGWYVEEFYPELEIDWIKELEKCNAQGEWGVAENCVLCQTAERVRGNKEDKCSICPLFKFGQTVDCNGCGDLSLYYAEIINLKNNRDWDPRVMHFVLGDCIRWMKEKQKEGEAKK